jgi:hypothetical protein
MNANLRTLNSLPLRKDLLKAAAVYSWTNSLACRSQLRRLRPLGGLEVQLASAYELVEFPLERVLCKRVPGLSAALRIYHVGCSHLIRFGGDLASSAPGAFFDESETDL